MQIWPVMLFVGVGTAGLYLLYTSLPHTSRRVKRTVGSVLCVLALLCLAMFAGSRVAWWPESLLDSLGGFVAFWSLAGVALGCVTAFVTGQPSALSLKFYAGFVCAVAGMQLLLQAYAVAAVTLLAQGALLAAVWFVDDRITDEALFGQDDTKSSEPWLACLCWTILAGSLVGTMRYAVAVEAGPQSDPARQSAWPSPDLVETVYKQLPAGRRTDPENANGGNLFSAVMENHWPAVEILAVLVLTCAVGGTVVIRQLDTLRNSKTDSQEVERA